jgi:hypothetical protein
MRRTLLVLITSSAALSFSACGDDRPLSSLPTGGGSGGTGGKKDAGKDSSQEAASGGTGGSAGAAGAGGAGGADASVEDAPSDVSDDTRSDAGGD